MFLCRRHEILKFSLNVVIKVGLVMQVSIELLAKFMDEFGCKLFMKRLTRAMNIDEVQLYFSC